MWSCIYDTNGRVIKQILKRQQKLGLNTLNWNGTNDQGQSVSGGIYFYIIETNTMNQTGKMILIK